MRNIAIYAIVCAFGVHAVPAPQVPAPGGVTAPDLSKHMTCAEDGSGIYVGDLIQPCGNGTVCINNQCDFPSAGNAAGSGGSVPGAGAGVPDPAPVGSTGAASAAGSVPSQAELNAAAGDASSGAAPGGAAAGGAPPPAQPGVPPAGGAAAPNPSAQQGAPPAGDAPAPDPAAQEGVSSAAAGGGNAGAWTEPQAGATAAASAVAGGGAPPVPTRADLSSGPGLENGQYKMTGEECRGRPDSAEYRYVGYWAQFYEDTTPPTKEQFDGITHVILSFAQADGLSWAWVNKEKGAPPTFTNDTVGAVRAVVGDSVKIMAAFGGWGQDEEFAIAAASGSMETIATNMVTFANQSGLDGIDLDWEYPVNYGADYKETGTVQQNKTYEINAYIDLMRHIRKQAPDLILSVAVPAIEGDTIAFTKESVPDMDKCLDFWNVMSYDYVNRRSGKSWHHQGGAVVERSIKLYEDKGVPPNRINFGYGTYAKWWTLAGTCSPDSPLDCDLAPAEFNNNGSDNAMSGVWKWNTITNDEPDPIIQATAQQLLALGDGASDENAQASAWVDSNNRFWSWLTPKNIADSCAKHRGSAGGVFLWSMNGDTEGTNGGPSIRAMAECVKGAGGGGGAG